MLILMVSKYFGFEFFNFQASFANSKNSSEVDNNNGHEEDEERKKR